MSKFFESLSSKAGRLARQASLANAARGLRRKIEEELVALGRKTYELFQAEAIESPELGDGCQRVAGLYQELKQLEEEIEALRAAPGGGAACRKCGANVEAGQAFCVNCGAAVSRCPKCGETLAGEARFCASCGAEVAPPSDETSA